MTLPKKADVVIIGAGIHGLSAAFHLSKLRAGGAGVVVLDKTGVGAGASGIACGVVRNNYFQSAMRELMAHSVEVWESDAEAYSYHSVGYLQISPPVMREGMEKIHCEQQAIGYDSEFVVGAREADAYMKSLLHDWRAAGVDSVLHEKRGGYANNKASLRGLAKKAKNAGAAICEGVTVTGFKRASQTNAVAAVQTDKGDIECEQVVVAAGPWVKTFWDFLQLPDAITIAGEGEKPMWRYWALQEGVLDIPPQQQQTTSGAMPPVIHLDSAEPLYADGTGELLRDEMWGVYYKPDFGFGGVQGGAAPNEVKRPASEVCVDPYGPQSSEFVVGADFAKMWTSALAFCQSRFIGKGDLFRKEPSGGIGCFTPDSFPVFDRFCDNAYFIADSNHGYKMLGVGKLVASELSGKTEPLLRPFRQTRFAEGKTHPQSKSPFPWS